MSARSCLAILLALLAAMTSIARAERARAPVEHRRRAVDPDVFARVFAAKRIPERARAHVRAFRWDVPPPPAPAKSTIERWSERAWTVEPMSSMSPNAVAGLNLVLTF